MNNKNLLRCLAGGLLATAMAATQAADFRPDAVSLQAAGGGNGTAMAGVGLVWDWDWKHISRESEVTAQTELMLNGWRAEKFGGGDRSFTQVVVLPSLRMRLGQGRSPFFIDLGIGASYMDPVFVTPHKTFSTRWNFYDMLGVGWSLDQQRRHELGVRYVHISNAGFKHPNPGQDFLQVRYVARF
jgi:lipid A 3-O-deacylase